MKKNPIMKNIFYVFITIPVNFTTCPKPFCCLVTIFGKLQCCQTTPLTVDYAYKTGKTSNKIKKKYIKIKFA